MATSTIVLPVASAVPPDGSTGNLAPGIVRIQGTEANPKKHMIVAQFDATAAEYLWWSFRLPAGYVSGGAVKVSWMANLASGNSVVWAASLGAVTPADVDTPVEHANAAASSTTTAADAVEARRLVETSITLAALDSAAAGDVISLLVYRDAANAADTLTVDAEMLIASFEYTS